MPTRVFVGIVPLAPQNQLCLVLAWISFGVCDSRRFLIGDSSLFSPVGVYSAYSFMWNYIFPLRGLLFFSFLSKTYQSPKDKIAYVTLKPVADYVYILDLNIRLRVG